MHIVIGNVTRVTRESHDGHLTHLLWGEGALLGSSSDGAGASVDRLVLSLGGPEFPV